MQKKVSECVLKFKERSVPYGIFLFAFSVLFLLFTMHPRDALHPRDQGSAAENQGKASAGNASAAGNEAVTAADKSGNAAMDGISAEKFGKVAVDGSTGFIASERIEKKMQFEKAISIAEEKRQKAKAKRLQEEALLLAQQRRESILAGRTFASAYAGPDDSLESSSGAGTYAGGTSEGSALQRAIVSYVLQFVGNPYVWGGESLTNGCDCSGFVMKVYEKYGYSLPHYSGSQANRGEAVSLTDLEPGDLVFYLHGGRIGHVAMYIGNGKIVHAKSRRDGIVVTSVNYARSYSAVRLV